MLEYKFYKNEIGTPQFNIIGELQGLNELGSCNNEYLEEILTSLEQVMGGDLEQFDFGYEVYSIDCKIETSQVMDTFDGWKVIAEITTKEVYKLMQDWKNYLSENSNEVNLS